MKKIFASDAARSEWLKDAIAVSFLACGFIANRLWTSARLYPRTPALPALAALPGALDYFFAAALGMSLIAAVISKKPFKYIVAAIAIATFLVLEDQGRLFPSFYEYLVLLLVFALAAWERESAEKSRFILNVCRLGIAFIYIWSGAQKLNPFFEGQLSWVMLPILNALPALRGSFLHALAWLAPLVEIEIGIGLLFKKTRAFALGEALLMHAGLAVLIGPMRDPWNAGAWAWNCASAAIVFILFFQTDAGSARDLLAPRPMIAKPAYASALFFLGFLPALNFINLWGSGPSFNVYSGNVTHAELYVSDTAAEKLPAELQTYLKNLSGTSDHYYFLDMSAWSEHDVRAEPDPETRVFKNIGAAICGYADAPEDVALVVHEKLRAFETPDFLSGSVKYDCATLQQKS